MSAPRRIHKHAQAKQDLIESNAYLLERNETAARRFLQETRQAFELILKMPGIGRRWESSVARIKGLRVTAVSRRFHDYLVFYRETNDGVQIITILHGSPDLPALIDLLADDGSDSP